MQFQAKEQRMLKLDRQPISCRFSADGHRVFAAGYDGQLYVGNLPSPAPEAKPAAEPAGAPPQAKPANDKSTPPAVEFKVFAAHRGWVEGMARTNDGTKLLSADSWGQIICWDITGAEPKQLWTVNDAHSTWLRHMTVRADDKWIATCGNDRAVRVFDAAGKPVAELQGHTSPVFSVAFHPSGALVSGDTRGIVKHWDVEKKTCIREFDAKLLFKPYNQYGQGGVRAMTFDAAGKTLYCGGFEGENANQAHGKPTVLAFDWDRGTLATTHVTAEAYKGPITDLAWHPGGFLVAAGSSEGGGALWFWKPGVAKNFAITKCRTSLRRIDLIANGQRMAAAAFGDSGGQRGGNGRRLNAKGDYDGFDGSVYLFDIAAA